MMLRRSQHLTSLVHLLAIASFILIASPSYGACTGSIRSAYNTWNYVLVTAIGFPSPSAATAALSGAASEWNSNCNSAGEGTMPTVITSDPNDGTALGRFTLEYSIGPIPDTSVLFVCGLMDNGVHAYVFQFMRTGLGSGDLAPCPLDDPLKLRHIFAHEIGHRFGLADSTCSDHVMAGIPQGSDASIVQQDECAMANQLNSTATERNVCDNILDCKQSPVLLTCEPRDWELSSLEGGVWFDYDSDGVMTRTAWTLATSSAGFLFTDLDSSGCAETGAELFGDNRRIGELDLANNGFEALASYDSDFDGQITPADVDWSSFRVWIDSSHDGKCTRDEVFTLSEIGFVTIDLNYHPSGYVDPYGNEFRFVSSGICRTQGGKLKRRSVYDVFFFTSGQD